MGFWRSLYDPFIALYFFGGLTLLLSLFVLVKMRRAFWEGMTAFSCLLALVGVMGLVAAGRINFAEEVLTDLRDKLEWEYDTAKTISHQFADHYSVLLENIESRHLDDKQKTKEAEEYFKRAVELLDRGYRAYVWRELMDGEAMPVRTYEKINVESIRNADKRASDFFNQKDWMLSWLRGVLKTERTISEFEQNKKRQVEETILSLLWPYLVAISLAIQFTKALATIRGFSDSKA